jgi:hypothetical protein
MILDKRMSKQELSDMTAIPYPTIVHMVSRGSAKIESIRKMEAVLGDISQYMKK